MAPRNRTSDEAPDRAGPDEVVRLPVSEHDLSEQLEAMPVPGRRVRMQPSPVVNLHEEEVEEGVERTPKDLGMPWEEVGEVGRHQTPVGWLGLIGLILIGVGAWAVTSLSKGEERVGERAGRIAEDLQRDIESRAQAQRLLERVEEVARAYLGAETVEEKGKYVRHAKRVLPLMRAYYARHGLAPAHFRALGDLRPFAIENRPFMYLEAELEDGGRRSMSLEQTEDGGLRFDWESEVCYQPIGIEEFVERKPEEAVDLRVYARLDTFYSYEFSDPERYQALMLTERDSEHFLFGYVELGTEEAEQLDEILSQDVAVPKPVMVRVRFLPGTRARRSVLVEKLVSPRWIYAEDPS